MEMVTIDTGTLYKQQIKYYIFHILSTVKHMICWM